MSIKKINIFPRSILAAAVGLSCQSVLAEESNKKESALEEVIVTALRRATSLQDTPISISALSEASLERIGANDLIDLVGSVPGLNLRDNGPGQTRPIIRGVQAAGEPTVGIYFGETPVSGSSGTTNDAGRFTPEMKPFDVDRVEVLKGPQGTLYGGGSMGGTVRILFNQPDASEFSGKVNVQGSKVSKGDTGYQLNAMVNIPLVEDELALRIVGFKRDAPGFVDNVTLGNDDINDVDTTGGRFALKWTPNDTFSATGSVAIQDQEVGGGFHINPALGDDDPKTNAGAQEPFLDDSTLYNLTLENSFGWADALYSFSYYERDAEYFFYNDFNFNPFPPLLSRQPQSQETVTHEFRLSSAGEGKWDWTTGVFYQNREAEAEGRVSEPTADGREPSGPLFFNRTVESEKEQSAIFGEVSYHFTDKLVGTVGARFFKIEEDSLVVLKVAASGATGSGYIPIVPNIHNPTQGDETGSIYKLHLAYDLSDDILLYGQFSQGYRAGGANQNTSAIAITDGSNAGIPEYFDSDTVDNYELGIHSEWLDGQLIVNGAVYYMNWDDMQISQRTAGGLFSYFDNSGGAAIKGLELEIASMPTDDLRFDFGISYVNAELTEDGPVARFRSGGVTYSRSGIDGDAIPNVPELTVNASMDYGWDITDGLRGIFYVSANYVDKSASDFNPVVMDVNTLTPTSVINPYYSEEQGDYTLVDFRIGVESSNDWSAFLFVENAFDKRGITHVFKDGQFRREPGYNFIEKPRTIGFSLTKEF